MKYWLNFKQILLVLCVLSLNSCGFSPVYSASSKSAESLRLVKIQPINSVEGAEFFNSFLNRSIKHNNELDHRYLLECNLNIDKHYNIIQRNSDILRNTITLTVHYKLIDRNTEAILLNSKFSRFSAYNTASLPYNNYASEKNIINNLASFAAEEMLNRLVHFFKEE